MISPITWTQFAEAVGIVAVTAALLFAGLCIWANAEFKERGSPRDEGDDW